MHQSHWEVDPIRISHHKHSEGGADTFYWPALASWYCHKQQCLEGEVGGIPHFVSIAAPQLGQAVERPPTSVYPVKHGLASGIVCIYCICSVP